MGKSKRKREKLKKSKLKDVPKQAESAEASESIQISHCQTVQVHPQNNYYIMNQDVEKNERDTEEDLRNHQRTQGLLIIRIILKNRRGKATYADLEEEVHDVLSKGGAQSFEKSYGAPLHRFIRQNHNDFDLYKENEMMYVEIIENKYPQKSYAEMVVGATGPENNPFEALETSEHDPKAKSHSIESASEGEGDVLPGSSTEDWQIIGTWNKKRKQHANIETQPIPMAFEVTKRENTDMTISYLKSLLEQTENVDLKFLPSHELYASNKLRCQRDIVSMWNTPHRVKSHIVIGVIPACGDSPAKSIGTDPDFDVSFYIQDNLFRDTVFTNVPNYEYTNVEYDSMTFGVIEIACSCKKGQPSIAKTHLKEGDVEVSENELWYRKGPSNLICPTSDPTASLIFQWFFGGVNDMTTESNNIERFFPPEAISSSEKTEEINIHEGEFTKFYNRCHEFKKGHSILISGNVSNKIKHLAEFALIPFLTVYDFDIFSCSKGLFNAVQDSAEKKRQLRVGTWRDPAPALSEKSTYWCFVRGRSEIPPTRTDPANGTIESQIDWFQVVKTGILENCQQLADFSEDYTVLTVIILWPEEERLVPFIRKFLDRLIDTLSYVPNITVCMHRQTRTVSGETQLKALIDEYSNTEEPVHVCYLDYSQLCIGIASRIEAGDVESLQYTLPKAENDALLGKLKEKDAMWLKEDMEVLYLKSSYQTRDDASLEEENSKFYKGGTLPWFAWYQNGDNGVDINRDILKEAALKIEARLEERRPPVLTILHAPGSGGTTLAQRILWNFHTKIPCVYVKTGSLLRSKEFTEKLQLLYDHTQLTTLLLIDGEDENIVKQLHTTVKHTLILFVKRYPFRMRDSHQSDTGRLTHKDSPRGHQKKNVQEAVQQNKVYLKGHVSFVESQMLVTKFGERCTEAQRNKLKKLKKDVKKNKSRHMYEFGMTVYNHEFRGIVAYVKGYLQLPQDIREPLQPWQRCLGYMSLVYFYGQTSVPCQFFAKLFGKPSNYIMSLEDDFPYPSSEFIVYDTTDSKQQTFRICHYEVAKEILEQILSRSCKDSGNRGERLGMKASRHLAEFAKEFIDYCSNKKKRTSGVSHEVRHMLTKTFIFRDEIDVSENSNQRRKRPQLSQLLQDIPSSSFSERLHVLEHLSTSFPDDPNYHAHVGRFHAFCGTENTDKAEVCFNTAIKLCEKRSKGNDIDESTKRTLIHVYHMYGVLKKKQIATLAGSSHRNNTEACESKEAFETQLVDLVAVSDTACDFFTKSRELTPETCDIFADAYLCEIEVRLQICDFVMRHFKPRTDENQVFIEFFQSEVSEECKVFVQESIHTIETLLTACCQEVDLDPGERSHIQRFVKWYKSLFRLQDLPEETLVQDDEISSKRIKIAQLKLNHGGKNTLNGVENVLDVEAVDEIVKLYEEIFQAIHFQGLGGHGKKDVDNDYREWICAIRHDLSERKYGLEDVLMHVTRWHNLVRSPMSTFYMFVIKSVIGFGMCSVGGKTEYLIEAKTLKNDMAKKTSLVLRPKFPREWLGRTGFGIDIIQPGNRNIGLHHDSRDHTKAPLGSDLAVCKGTIMHPNGKSFYGQIMYDIQVADVKVYFLPRKVSLEGPRHAGLRVEFNLAFTIEHGYEAFNVKLLKRYGCSKCSAKVEFTSVDVSLPCTNCGEEIQKDDLNLVNDVEVD